MEPPTLPLGPRACLAAVGLGAPEGALTDFFDSAAFFFSLPAAKAAALRDVKE